MSVKCWQSTCCRACNPTNRARLTRHGLVRFSPGLTACMQEQPSPRMLGSPWSWSELSFDRELRREPADSLAGSGRLAACSSVVRRSANRFGRKVPASIRGQPSVDPGFVYRRSSHGNDRNPARHSSREAEEVSLHHRLRAIPGRICILAVAHMSRRPSHWISRQP